MSNKTNAGELDGIQEWFQSACDGDWEHQYGVRIVTLDNPGWSVDIDLSDTLLMNKHFKRIVIDRDDTDWLRCEVKDAVFKGRCGARNLKELLNIFLSWTRDE